jgi:hypothetical protein
MVINYSLLRKYSSKPELRVKQYKRVRDVMTYQGYIVGAIGIGYYVLYDHGSATLKKYATDTAVALTSVGAIVFVGKAITLTRKLGRVYRLGTVLYNGGMLVFKCFHFWAQSSMISLDLIMIGEIYLPNVDAKWWEIDTTMDN